MNKILVILLAFSLVNCSPLRHYKKVAEDPNRNAKERELLAPVCALEFPVISSVDSTRDTTKIIIRDTLPPETIIKETLKYISKDCPRLNVDSLSKVLSNKLKPVEIETTIRTTVTRVKADSAALFIVTEKYLKASKEAERYKESSERWEKKSKKNFWWLIVAVILLPLSHIVRSKLF